MAFSIPKYTSREALIMVSILTPATVAFNSLLFGEKYYTQASIFFPATLLTFLLLALSWQLHTIVALILKSRLPEEHQTNKRITLAILMFLLMTSLNITLIFYGYDYIHFLGYNLNEELYLWALLIGGVTNVFVTFVQEGVASFEKWKATLKETEQLKKEYLHGQLLGLKSQVNPHFLFNSLNSLSSLISEDQEKAERFLDEMSRVYRYLLRNNDDKLIDLNAELQFIRSYAHLLTARYGDGIQIRVNVESRYRTMMIAPLTVQILLENALNLNRINKETPLYIEICVNEKGWLQIRNNIQKKIRKEQATDDSGLENICNKYKLLCHQSVIIHESASERIIEIPLINETESVVYE